MNIEHPVFTGSVMEEWIRDEEGNALYWPVDDYFYPGRRETVFLGEKVVKQHHTLTRTSEVRLHFDGGGGGVSGPGHAGSAGHERRDAPTHDAFCEGKEIAQNS